MPKIMLNCRSNGWRKLGRTLKRLLDEAPNRSGKPWLVTDDDYDDDGDNKGTVECKALVELHWKGKCKVLGEKTSPLTLRPPQNTHRMNWDRTGGSAARPRLISRHLRLDRFSNTRKTFILKSRKRAQRFLSRKYFHSYVKSISWGGGGGGQLRPLERIYYRDLNDAP